MGLPRTPPIKHTGLGPDVLRRFAAAEPVPGAEVARSEAVVDRDVDLHRHQTGHPHVSARATAVRTWSATALGGSAALTRWWTDSASDVSTALDAPFSAASPLPDVSSGYSE